MANSSQLGSFQLGDAQLGGVPAAPSTNQLNGSGRTMPPMTFQTMSAGALIRGNTPPPSVSTPGHVSWWWWGDPSHILAQHIK